MLTGSLSLSFSRRFYPPCQLFARLSLLRLPHYMRAWNRLPPTSLLTRCHDTSSLLQGGFFEDNKQQCCKQIEIETQVLTILLTALPRNQIRCPRGFARLSPYAHVAPFCVVHISRSTSLSQCICKLGFSLTYLAFYANVMFPFFTGERPRKCFERLARIKSETKNISQQYRLEETGLNLNEF